jgi:hypothetical protein
MRIKAANAPDTPPKTFLCSIASSLKLIRKDMSKGGIHGKRLQTARDDAFLWHLLLENNS